MNKNRVRGEKEKWKDSSSKENVKMRRVKKKNSGRRKAECRVKKNTGRRKQNEE